MTMLRLHKNALSGKFEVVKASGGNLLDLLAEHAHWAADGAIIKLNGELLADSSRHADMDNRCDIELTIFDSVDVYCLPQTDPLSWWQIALIAIGATAVAIALAPKPKLPNQDGNKTGQNNQLNAANNAFRPREAIPDISGEVVSFPDFLQRSYYTYEGNRRVFTELFCFGIGGFEISEVKDGETLIDEIPTSSYEIFQPNVAPDGLLDVRTAEGSEDLPLPATDDTSRSSTITNGSFLSSNVIDLGAGGETIITDLGLQTGQNIRLDVWYTFEGSQTQLIEDFGITGISGTQLTLTPSTLPLEDGGTVNGSIIQFSGGVAGRWFTLAGSAITEIRWHLKMPQGIRKADGTVGRVNYLMEYQEVDTNGNPIGTPSGFAGSFSGSTSEPQYITQFKTGLTASRYRARATRTSAKLGNDAADLLVLERVESVTPYSGSGFGDVTTIRVMRGTAPAQGRGASNKISAKVKRKLKLFNPTTGTFAATTTATRSFAQYIMYLLVERAKIPLSNIDYQSLFDIEASLAEELTYFDFTFDDFDVGFRDRLETALNVARCYYYMVGNRYMFGRDEERAARVAVFNRRNIVPEQSEEGFTLYRENDFDSIELRYVDPVTNTDAYIRKKINASTGAIEDGLGESVYEYTLSGCRNEYQARNRAELEIRKIYYSWRVVKDTVGAEALSVGVGQRVGWSDIADEGVFTGEVLAQSGTTFTTSEPWTHDGVSTYYVYIVQADGTVSNSVVCTQPVGQPYQFVASGLTATIADGYEVQRGSLYFIAPLTNLAARDYILTKRDKPNERGQCRIELINYDERMYDYDDTPPPSSPLAASATGGSSTIDSTTCDNTTASATVTATGGSETYTYSWTKLSGDGAISSGSTSATMVVAFTSVCPETTQSGIYRCTVSAGFSSVIVDVTYSAQNVGIDPAGDPLTATSSGGFNGVANVNCVNVLVSATVAPSGGSGIYTYSWTKLSGDGTISAGSTSATMTVLFTSVCPEQIKSGVYRCAVSDGTDTVNVDVTYTAENFQPLS